MLKEIIRNTTFGAKRFLLVIWLIPASLSFLFPKWTYYEIYEAQGAKRLYKQGGSATVPICSSTPLHISHHAGVAWFGRTHAV